MYAKLKENWSRLIMPQQTRIINYVCPNVNLQVHPFDSLSSRLPISLLSILISGLFHTSTNQLENIYIISFIKICQTILQCFTAQLKTHECWKNVDLDMLRLYDNVWRETNNVLLHVCMFYDDFCDLFSNLISIAKKLQILIHSLCFHVACSKQSHYQKLYNEIMKKQEIWWHAGWGLRTG